MTKHTMHGACARPARGLVAISVALATMVGVARPAGAVTSVPGMSASSLAVAFEWAIDVERGRHGLAALAVDPTVSAQAQAWSGGMALFDTLAEDRHYSAEIAASDPAWQLSAENVGVGAAAPAVEAAFVASAPHLANMLGAYTHVGVGVFIDGTGHIWVTERFYR